MDKPSENDIVELHSFIRASKLTDYIPSNLIEIIDKLMKYYIINEEKGKTDNE